MATPKFSVVLPVYSELEPVQGGAASQIHFRGRTVQRAIKSILNQQFTDWELIIVDDGCIDNITPAILDKFAEADPRIKVMHTDNGNRAIARNRGMDAATGEWLCWLDSDDEYMSNYLRELERAITANPDAKVINFRTIFSWPDRTQINDLFKPAIEGEGHEWFRAGKLTCGSFVFRRDMWAEHPEKYRMPDEANPYQFAADSKFDWRLTREEDEWKYDNTENPDTMFGDGVKRHGSSLGNPWGDDFFQFYLLTRDNHALGLELALYITYPRTSEDDEIYFGETYPAEIPS